MMKYWLSLLLILLIGLATGCSLSGSSNVAASISGEWVLAELNGQPPIAGRPVTIHFENGQLGGNTGCNSYGGKYAVNGQKLSVSSIFQTEMACMDPQGIMDQESAYLQTLNQSASFDIVSGKLEIKNASGQAILVYNPGTGG